MNKKTLYNIALAFIGLVLAFVIDVSVKGIMVEMDSVRSSLLVVLMDMSFIIAVLGLIVYVLLFYKLGNKAYFRGMLIFIVAILVFNATALLGQNEIDKLYDKNGIEASETYEDSATEDTAVTSVKDGENNTGRYINIFCIMLGAVLTGAATTSFKKRKRNLILLFVSFVLVLGGQVASDLLPAASSLVTTEIADKDTVWQSIATYSLSAITAGVFFSYLAGTTARHLDD